MTLGFVVHKCVRLGDFRNICLIALLQRIQKLAVAGVEFIEGPSRHTDSISQNAINQPDRNLLLGLKLDVLWYVRFFRRAGSLAQSSGRYN